MECKLKLREIREVRGMTQRRIAKALDKTPGAVAKWDLGYTMPTLEKLVALADLLDCTTDEILGRTRLDSTASQ